MGWGLDKNTIILNEDGNQLEIPITFHPDNSPRLTRQVFGFFTEDPNYELRLKAYLGLVRYSEHRQQMASWEDYEKIGRFAAENIPKLYGEISAALREKKELECLELQIDLEKAEACSRAWHNFLNDMTSKFYHAFCFHATEKFNGQATGLIKIVDALRPTQIAST